MTRLKAFVSNPVERPPADTALPYVALEHIESGTGRLLPSIALEEVIDDTAVTHRAGDVRFGKLRPYLAKSLYMADDGQGSGELLVLRPRSGLDPRFLHYLSLSEPFVEWATATAYGVKMPRTNFEAIGAFQIDPPSIQEQQRVVDHLDQETARITKLVAEQEQQIRLITERRYALVSAAVRARLGGGPGSLDGVLLPLPPSWRLLPLRTLASIQSGLTLGKTYHGAVEERPYLRVANVQDGSVDLTEVWTIEVPRPVALGCELRAGDVLMTEGGDNDKLGRGTVWQDQIEGCLHQNHIFAVRPDQTLLRPRYLALLTASSWGRAYFMATAHQTTNLAATNRAKVGRFPVPLPPLEEQDELLVTVDEEMTQLDAIETELARQVSLLCERRQALITHAVTHGIDGRLGAP